MSGFLSSMVGATYAAAVPAETHYFAATVGNDAEGVGAVACDPDGNAYSTFQTFSATLIGNRDIYFCKRNSAGVFQWARRIGTSGQSWTGANIGVTSYGYAQVSVSNNSSSAYLYIIDSANGDILAVKTIKGSDNNTFNINGANQSMIVNDSQMFVLGVDGASPARHCFMGFDPTSGTMDWARQITHNNNSTVIGGIGVSANGNNPTIVFGSGADQYVARYSTAGAVTWQRKLTYTDQDTARSIAVDSTGAVYVSSRINSTGGQFIAKIASNGSSVLFTKTIEGLVGANLCVDADNNFYVISRVDSTGAMFVAKFDSSGTLQYRRTITAASEPIFPQGPSATTATSLFINGQHLFSTADNVLFKMPLDGSKTGTYSLNGKNFTYAANTSITVATTPSATLSTSTLTTGSTAGSSNDFTSYTTNTNSLTNYLTTL